MELTLENLEKMLLAGGPKMLEKHAAGILPAFKRWAPQPGPQSDAYFSKADELLYGGAAGGGKSDLLLGLATTAHERSVIFRQQSVDLTQLWDRLNDIVPNPAKSDANKKAMKIAGSQLVEMGHLELPGSERGWMGRAHDLIGFDEAALLDELRVNFVSQWLRSIDPKRRCRIVMATNPPIPEIKDGVMTDTAVGDWLLRWFAPWVDPTYPNPAKEGELRWCYMRAEGDRLVTVWTPGPGAYDVKTGELKPDATREDVEEGRVNVAKSRTFIRSLVSNNVYYRDSGYAAQLSGTPEPLRSMLLLGDFTVKGEDHPRQVIPTQWVLMAQQRWRERHWEEVKRLRQLVLAGDIAQGGMDTTVLAPLYETDYFDELITAPGSETPTGEEVEAMILTHRLDNSVIVLDGQGGWAGETRGFLKRSHNIDAELFISSGVDGSWADKMPLQFFNNRAKMWWQFREALDPKSMFEVCLPPSTRLRAQLTVPHYDIRGKKLLVESKEEIRKRINSSTDEADAVLMAWQYREDALYRLLNPVDDLVERLNGRTQVNRYTTELEDPRGAW